MEAMMAAARQAVAELCSIKPEDVFVSEKGVIDYSANGSSTAVYFWADVSDDAPPSYSFRSVLLLDVEERPLMYKLLNDINADIPYGQVYFREGEIVFYYSLIIEKPEPSSIIAILEYMQEASDDYDDKLKTRLGGSRFLETDDDEVDV